MNDSGYLTGSKPGGALLATNESLRAGPLGGARAWTMLVPCYDEVAAMADVVRAFRATLPDPVVYICDNNSKDKIMEARMPFFGDRNRLWRARDRDICHLGARGIVPRFPVAILSTELTTTAFPAFTGRLILDTVTRGRREMKLLAYLRYGAPGDPARD